jgi:hypothetical protein
VFTWRPDMKPSSPSREQLCSFGLAARRVNEEEEVAMTVPGVLVTGALTGIGRIHLRKGR